MKHSLLWLLSLSIISLWFYTSWAAPISFDVTPIKYEIDADPGESITRTATISNKSDSAFTITTGTSDFQSSGLTGQPSFVRRSELVYPDQQLSSWISIDTPGFIIAPNSSQTINFTINIPENATPGWHYGGVFFKNNASGDNTSGTLGVNIDYWVLILLNVSWDIVSDGNVVSGGIAISNWGSTHKKQIDNQNWDHSLIIDDDLTTPPLASDLDSCPLWDFTSSNFDGRCIDNPFTQIAPESNQDTTQIPEDTDSSNENNSTDDWGDFSVVFDIPFENNGNIHLKPEGSIVIKDENGNTIEQIGEKLIKNEAGAIIGKEIVDFLPINDEQWNVLPSSQRKFSYNWEGFPYTDLDGNIAYRSPGEYYTLKNKQDAGFLMFWERVASKKQYQTLTADIDLSYIDHEGNEIEFNAAPEFWIEYTQQYIGLNPYVIVPFALITTLWLAYGLRMRLRIKKKKLKKQQKKAEKKLKAGKKKKDSTDKK